MKKGNIASLLTGAMTLGLIACNQSQQTEFNLGWQFWSETQPVKQVVNLPHDAMQTETRSADVKEGRH